MGGGRVRASRWPWKAVSSAVTLATVAWFLWVAISETRRLWGAFRARIRPGTDSKGGFVCFAQPAEWPRPDQVVGAQDRHEVWGSGAAESARCHNDGASVLSGVASVAGGT